MVKRVVLGRSGEEKVVDLIREMSERATSGNTRPAGNKVLEWGEDFYWGRYDGTTHSMREIDEELEGARGRIEDAEASLGETQVRLDDAEQTVAVVSEDLTRVETVVIPGVVQELEQADAAAQQELATLDGKLVTAEGEITTAKENIGQLETDLATESDARDQLAQDVQGTFTELDTRLDTFGDDPALSGMRQALTDAQATATSASQAAAAADQAASAASQAALEAAGIAASKGRVIIQDTEPTGDDRQAANIWIKPAVDDPDTDITETATTYVYIAESNEWVPTTSDDLAQAAQNALDAREAAQQAQQRAETAISNAAAAQSAAEAAQQTADEATLDAREAHNGAVAAAERAEALRTAGENLLTLGSFDSGTLEEIFSGAGTNNAIAWTELVTSTDAYSGTRYIRLTGDNGWNGSMFLEEVPVTPGRTYRVSVAARITPGMVAPSGSVGWPMYWFQQDGSSNNGNWPKIYYSTDLASKLTEEWQVFTADVTAEPGAAQLRSRLYGNASALAPGEGVDFDSIRVIDATELVAAEQAAADAQARADEAYAEAESKLDESQVQAIADEAERLAKVAASADATAKAEQAEADAAVEAARIATEKANAAESNAALTAQQKATAAKEAAEATARAEDELLEARAAADAKTKADKALADAKAALAAARTQITAEINTSANGKNSITRSTSNASGSGTVAGDAWYKVDSNGDTMAMWIWNGSKWVASKVRNEMIDTIDVNKLKVHGSAEIEEAVIDKLFTQTFATHQLTAGQVVVSSGANLFVDAGGSAKMWSSSSHTTHPDGGKNGGWSLVIPSGDTSLRGGYGGLADIPTYGTPVEPGQKYRISAWVRGSVTGGSYGARIYVRSYDSAGDNYSFMSPANFNTGPLVANEWTRMEEVVTVPDTGTRMILGCYAYGYEGAIRYSDISVQQVAGAVLIEDGAISADKIQADSVGAAVGEFVHAEVGNLVATEGISTPEAVIDKLWVDGLVGKTATFNRFVVAGTNLAPRMTEEASGGWDLNGTATWIDSSHSSTGRAIQFKPVSGKAINHSAGWVNGPIYPVQPGTKYQVTAKVGRIGNLTQGGRYYIGLRGVTESGSITNYGPYAVSTESASASWDTMVGGEVIIPDGVNFARVYMLLEGVAGTAMSIAHTTIYDLTVKEKVGATLIEPGAVSTEHINFTGTLAGEVVDVMSVATKKLVVTQETILNHATLIGKTVVDDINVQGKLIGTNGVFTGTVDFANVNVTGTAIINKLGANSISADKVAGGSFSGQTFTGGLFAGAEFQSPVNPRWNGGIAIDPTSGFRAWNTAGKLTVQIHPSSGQIMLSDYLKAVNSSGRGVMLIPTTSTGGGGLWFSHTGGGGGSDAAIWRSGYDPNGVEPLSMRGANGGPVEVYGGLGVYSGGIMAIGGPSNFSDMIHTNPPVVTSGSANTVIASRPAGRFYKTGSSRRYKRNIANWSPEKHRVLGLQPRQWQDKVENDPDAVREAWGVGFIAEEVHDLGLTQLVSYEGDGAGGWIPQGLNYDRFAAAHQVVLRDHEAQINELRERIALLESK